MFDEDEERKWVLEERTKVWRARVASREENLESFESVKSAMRRREKFIWWRIEREISSAKVGIVFSNRDDVKKLFTRFQLRVVSDHVYQQ